MRFTDLFIRRPILAIVVSLLILLVGLSAVFALQIRQYPRMESATITIDTGLPGATQDVMQGFVTTPIAQSIATAGGIEYLTSTSTQGRSHIAAKLVLNADADRAMTEVLAKVQQVKYRLPEGVTDPAIAKITDGASAIQYVAFTSERLSASQIADFVNRVARPLITSVPGVASAEISGGAPPAMRIWVDPVKLGGRGLTAGDIGAALRANNVQAAPDSSRARAPRSTSPRARTCGMWNPSARWSSRAALPAGWCGLAMSPRSNSAPRTTMRRHFRRGTSP